MFAAKAGWRGADPDGVLQKRATPRESVPVESMMICSPACSRCSHWFGQCLILQPGWPKLVSGGVAWPTMTSPSQVVS